MESHTRLLLANKAWVQEKLRTRPDFFLRQAEIQRPPFLWIGCADSRVPSEEITGAEPGELFVHRNIANLIVHTDFNMLSVLQYAVEVLQVEHVIVCGHYNCGGVKNAMSRRDFGLINKWLRHIKDTYRIYHDQIDSIPDFQGRWDRLVEFNVTEQVQNLAKTSIIQRAWHSAQRPQLHGWVYDLRTGYLKELALLPPGSRIDDIYAFQWTEVAEDRNDSGDIAKAEEILTSKSS
jgi:carbonic anhydrase